MKKIIPLEYPPITTYPSIANVLSLLWSRKKQIMPWFSDHFIQIIVRPGHEDTKCDFYDHADLDNYFRILFGLPGLGWMRVNSETADFSVFTDYVEREINNDYGLEACLDRFYIQSSSSYQKKHFIHSSFIYGYDSDRKEIYVFDFWEHGKYEHRIISYDEANESMNNDGIINLFKAWDDHYEFKPELMKQYFKDYLNSTDSFHKFEFSNKYYNEGVLFGTTYYDYVLNKFDDGFVDRRIIHLLYDHKVLMRLRLEYLNQLESYDANKIHLLMEENEKLIEETGVIRNCVIKFNMTKSEKLSGQTKTLLKELKEKDSAFVEKIVLL